MRLVTCCDSDNTATEGFTVCADIRDEGLVMMHCTVQLAELSMLASTSESIHRQVVDSCGQGMYLGPWAHALCWTKLLYNGQGAWGGRQCAVL